jgi:hypothetical protein
MPTTVPVTSSPRTTRSAMSSFSAHIALSLPLRNGMPCWCNWWWWRLLHCRLNYDDYWCVFRRRRSLTLRRKLLTSFPWRLPPPRHDKTFTFPPWTCCRKQSCNLFVLCTTRKLLFHWHVTLHVRLAENFEIDSSKRWTIHKANYETKNVKRTFASEIFGILLPWLLLLSTKQEGNTFWQVVNKLLVHLRVFFSSYLEVQPHTKLQPKISWEAKCRDSKKPLFKCTYTSQWRSS